MKTCTSKRYSKRQTLLDVSTYEMLRMCKLGCSGCSFSSFRDMKIRGPEVSGWTKRWTETSWTVKKMFNWHVTFMSPKQCFQKTKKPSKHGKKKPELFFFQKKKQIPREFSHYFFHYSVGMFLGIFISRSGHSLKGRKPAPGDSETRKVINVEVWNFDGKIHRWLGNMEIWDGFFHKWRSCFVCLESCHEWLKWSWLVWSCWCLMFFGTLQRWDERWKVKGGLILHFEKKWRGKYTLYTRIMDSTFDFWNIQVALRMIEEAWKPKTFVSTLKVHCDVVGHTVSTHSQECARLIDRERLAREGGRWLALPRRSADDSVEIFIRHVTRWDSFV